MFDHVHRRSATSEAIETYPEAVLSAHEAFTHQIMSSSAARVEVIYGQHVQRRILKTMRCSLLPLWGPYSGVFLVLLYESNFSNADKDFMFRRVLLFATHPQRLFYEPPGSTITVRQDLTFQVAACITGINFDPTYYQAKKWLSKTPSVFELGQHFLKRVVHHRLCFFTGF